MVKKLHPLFDELGDWSYLPEVSTVREGLTVHPFYFELTERTTITIPWMDNQALQEIQELWIEKGNDIQSFFAKRDRERAKKPMIHSIGLLLCHIYWTNNIPVPIQERSFLTMLQQLKWKPVNCLERISFLVEKPSHYHSYIQLNELFTEAKKQYYTSQVKKK